MFIADPIFSIQDPGLRVNKIPDPGSGFFPSRIRIPEPGVKKHRIRDPGSGSWDKSHAPSTTETGIYFFASTSSM